MGETKSGTTTTYLYGTDGIAEISYRTDGIAEISYRTDGTAAISYHTDGIAVISHLHGADGIYSFHQNSSYMSTTFG